LEAILNRNCILPIIPVCLQRFVSKSDEVAFIEVRTQVSNSKSFVQERITGIENIKHAFKRGNRKGKIRELMETAQNACVKNSGTELHLFSLSLKSFQSIVVDCFLYGGLQNVPV